MDELEQVYHTGALDRADFKIAVQQYLAFRGDHAKLKLQIKAKYRQAGVVRVEGTAVFSRPHRKRYLMRLSIKPRQKIMTNLYAGLDGIGHLREAARADMVALGRRYPAIRQFQCMPGIGVVGSHAFSEFIQTPHQFATKQKLWRYCQLDIIGRSSTGKPLARTRLDRLGTGMLKAISAGPARCAPRIRTRCPCPMKPHCGVRATLCVHGLVHSAKCWPYFGPSGKTNVDHKPTLFMRHLIPQ